MRGSPSEEGAYHGSVLRFLTCGSVDDGKSTLIGRLLYDSNALPTDEVARLRMRSAAEPETLDLAQIVDGLEAEREQGITIDVAYRYFSTQKRSFIVADTPGHEQYTRNMATGASYCDAALILVDAKNGICEQTRRHCFICSLFGIETIALVINKMDLVEYAEQPFRALSSQFAELSRELEFRQIAVIPTVALSGDNVVHASTKMGWYEGPTILTYLEGAQTQDGAKAQPFRFPVQYVSRSASLPRGLSGTVASGRVRTGDEVVISPSGARSRISRVLEAGTDVAEAEEGDAVTLALESDIDAARGDMLAGTDDPPIVADHISAHVVWMDDEPLLPGRSYLMKIGTRWVPSTVTAIRHRVDVGTFRHLAAREVRKNEIAVCNVATAGRIVFDSFKTSRSTGSFILVDRTTNATSAAGLINFPLRRANNVRKETFAVDRHARAALKGQRPAVLWLTGLSGSGKSTIARRLEQALFERGRHTYVLDGDNLRLTLNNDLGFTAADRVENIRRAGEVARLMADTGTIVICAFISPFRADRQRVRELFAEREFLEIFVEAPLDVCMKRDPKGLYAKARSGALPNFTGIDSPYEPPSDPDLRLRTDLIDTEAAVAALLGALQARAVIPGDEAQ